MTAGIDAIVKEVLAVLGTGGQVSPFAARPAGLTLAEAYRVSAGLDRRRTARGEKRLGRKIGFTNRTIWQQYGVYAPIWGYVYDSTMFDLEQTPALPLYGFAEPRIEPEIVFGLAAAPAPGMDEAALLAPASTGWRMVSRSCSRSFRAGSLRQRIRLPPTVCMERC